jgi:hypothetical protein
MKVDKKLTTLSAFFYNQRKGVIIWEFPKALKEECVGYNERPAYKLGYLFMLRNL